MKHVESLPWALDTLLVHGGAHDRASTVTGIPTVLPIYVSTTYLHGDAQALDQAFENNHPSGEQAYVYARQGNPNTYSLEQALTQAERGYGAVVFGSGMSAIHTALLAAGLAPGKKVLASRDLYGATIGLFNTIFEPLGIEVIYRDLCCKHASEHIYTEKPDIVYVETLSNPLVRLTDLDMIANAARDVGATSLVDSTFTTPYLIQPIEHGCDLVVHSATKYLGGHGDSTAGVAICRTPELLEKLRMNAMLLGTILSPFESHLISRGLKTLSLRMERHCSNALQVAKFLDQHPAVERVHYPGLEDHSQHEVASRILRTSHYGGLLSFELKQQTREAAFQFMNNLQLCLPAPTLGDVFSLVSYPAMSSHRGLNTEELAQLGITEGCLRLSVGIEDINDILTDLDQALD